MKKLLAILAVVLLTASFAYAQPFDDPSEGGVPGPNSPYANDPFYSNHSLEFGPRTMWYQDVYYWADFAHGIPGNALSLASIYVDVLPWIQFTETQTENGVVLTPFMWNSGQKPEDMYPLLDRYVDQTDLAVDCDWMDYPEYVGCTSYFFLFVYRPLCVECLCENWLCLGIYSIPSYHNLYTEGSNPFISTTEKNGKYSCIWQITGQPNWIVVLSGEVLDMDPTDGVDVTWDWYGQNEPFNLAFPGTQFFQYLGVNNYTLAVYLPGTTSGDVTAGVYYAGVAANTVSVDQTASYGIKTFEATVSGFYYF